MMPQQISPTVERGVYIIWDPIRFQRDRVRLGYFRQTFRVCGMRSTNEAFRGNSRFTTAISTPHSRKARNERLVQPVQASYMWTEDAG